MSIEITQFFEKYSTIEIKKEKWSNLLEHKITDIAAQQTSVTMTYIQQTL